MSYIRRFVTKGKNKKRYVHYAIVSSHRNHDKVKQEFLVYLGTKLTQNAKNTIEHLDKIKKEDADGKEKEVIKDYLLARIFNSQQKENIAYADKNNTHLHLMTNKPIKILDIHHNFLDPRLNTKISNLEKNSKSIKFDLKYKWHDKPGKIKINIENTPGATRYHQKKYSSSFFKPFDINILK